MSNYFKISMFITSFLPLWSCIIFMNIVNIFYHKEENVLTECISIVIIIIINILGFIIITKIKNLYKIKTIKRIKVKNIVREDSINSEYLLSHVIPLLVFDFTVWYGVANFLIFFLFLSILCINNDRIYKNIYLEFLGYKVYSCQYTSIVKNSKSQKAFLITKDRLELFEDELIDVCSFNKPYYYYSSQDL